MGLTLCCASMTDRQPVPLCLRKFTLLLVVIGCFLFVGTFEKMLANWTPICDFEVAQISLFRDRFPEGLLKVIQCNVRYFNMNVTQLLGNAQTVSDDFPHESMTRSEVQ